MSVVKFSEVAHRANTKEDRFNTDKIYYVGGEHIEPGELFIHDKGIIKGSTIGPMFYCGFKSGQILFVTRNPHLRKCSVAEFDGICSEKTFVIETIDERILLQKYLASVMLSDDFWNYCEENKSGGVNYFLNWSTLADYEFELPSVEEQKAISDKVWAAYRLKESYKKLLAATEEMVKSQFIEMFGDPMVNDKQWSDYPCLSEVTQIVLGSTPNSKEPSYWDGDIRWITPAEMTDQSYYIYDTVRHITEEGRDAANLTMLPEGAVLFSTRAPIGKVAIVGKEMCCNQGFKNFICSEKLNKVFLYYTLKYKKDHLCSLGTGTTFKELSKKTVESLKIAVPPIDLQERFEDIYNQADKSEFDGFKSQFIEMFEGDKYPHEALDSIAADWLKGQPFRKDEIEESGIHSCIHYGELFTKYGPIISQVQSYTSSEPKRLSKSGDILFPASDVTPNGLARCSMLPFDDVILGGDIIILRPKEGFNSGFLSYAINNQTSQLLTRVNGGVVKHMSSKSLKSVLIPIPPMDKQEEYIGIAHQADKSEFELRKSIDAIDAVIKSLINS